jgi:hypothetical protein
MNTKLRSKTAICIKTTMASLNQYKKGQFNAMDLAASVSLRNATA